MKSRKRKAVKQRDEGLCKRCTHTQIHPQTATHPHTVHNLLWCSNTNEQDLKDKRKSQHPAKKKKKVQTQLRRKEIDWILSYCTQTLVLYEEFKCVWKYNGINKTWSWLCVCVCGDSGSFTKGFHHTTRAVAAATTPTKLASLSSMVWASEWDREKKRR